MVKSQLRRQWEKWKSVANNMELKERELIRDKVVCGLFVQQCRMRERGEQ
ncbi:hypothetical protein C5167_032855 [Papaver somniferum]|uniref:Uncharacterized protein n=1 Tax=Papaver somniferum TaxID=3469 RepID=A0A4Y7K8R4_PAPSO|nr:hypothetical protein C5167_032855 [Papaver somniferum]